MKKQATNPYLPLDVYIPDGEPHVFGDRVYIFGSHDKEGGETYCMLSYEFWSAPIDDLGNWSSKGINFSASQDPLSKETGRPYLYAPDVCQGTDGRFYLYYCLSGEKGQGGYHGPIGVAVCDTPDGKYEFHGHVHYPDGRVCYDFVPFDPAVINDDGTIRLYYGARYPFDSLPRLLKPIMDIVQASMFQKRLKEVKQGVMGAVHCTLKPDMVTIQEPPQPIFPASFKGTPMECKMCIPPQNGQFMAGHGFFEGASIRKIGSTYYFIYSSANNHELCYCRSQYPDRDFVYGGVILSTGDVGYCGRLPKDRVNNTGTTHGSIEKIGDQWYVFYHRLTHGTDYSRQACAEKIEILPDGSIPQVQVTSCGLNGGDLDGIGSYNATICCQLTNGKMPHNSNGKHKGLPIITHEGDSRFIRGMTAGTKAVYKYFDLSKTRQLTVMARGEGDLRAFGQGQIHIASSDWAAYSISVSGETHTELTLEVLSGQLDILELTFQ